MEYVYTIKIEEFLNLFNLKNYIVDIFDENLNDTIYDDFRELYNEIKKKLDEISRKIRMNLEIEDYSDLWCYFQENCVKYTEDIYEYISNQIEDWFNREVSPLFDDKVEINITTINYENVQFKITCDNLLENIGIGMDSYGMFSWNEHSQEDKDIFLKDGYLVLRELLHYYEACESKIKINIDYQYYNFYKIDSCALEEMMKFILDGNLELILTNKQQPKILKLKEYENNIPIEYGNIEVKIYDTKN